VQARSGQRLVQSGPIRTLARLDLGVFVDDCPVAAIEVVFDGRSLGIDAKPALALTACGNPVIADELPVLGIMTASLHLVWARLSIVSLSKERDPATWWIREATRPRRPTPPGGSVDPGSNAGAAGTFQGAVFQ
jgi:hypothetical protein